MGLSSRRGPRGGWRAVSRFPGSAIPALEQGDARGAQAGHPADRTGSGISRVGVLWIGSTREVPRTCPGQAQRQVLDEPSATLGANYGPARPVRLGPIAHLGMQGGAGARGGMLVIAAGTTGAGVDEGNDPVPVQQGNVFVRAGRRMPAQEMIVVGAELAGRVVVADIVIIGLRQWDVD